MKAVIDAATDKHLSIDEAISKGILDQAKGNYHNTLTGRLSKANSVFWLCRFLTFFSNHCSFYVNFDRTFKMEESMTVHNFRNKLFYIMKVTSALDFLSCSPFW